MELIGYWRSGAAYRTRIALELKGLSYDQVALDLRAGAQKAPAYLARNPQGLAPLLHTDDGDLTQSSAIIEWLEERYPEPALLPSSTYERAVVRAMAQIVGADIHPLNNLRVLKAIREDLGASRDQVFRWIHRWVGEGFVALEAMIQRHGRGYAFGDAPTVADCFLIPQVYSAERFEMDLEPYPHIRAVADVARGHPAFIAAEPANQPDADEPRA